MPLETILDIIMELNVILMGRSRNNMNLVRPFRESRLVQPSEIRLDDITQNQLRS